MVTRWTALAVLTVLVFSAIVPVMVVQNYDAGWLWMTSSITPSGDDIGAIFNLVLLLTVVLFVDIHAIMIFFVIRYREQDDPSPRSFFWSEMFTAFVSTVIFGVFGYYILSLEMTLTPALNFGGAVLLLLHFIIMYLVLHESDWHGQETSERHGHLGIEITWTIIPSIIMIFLGIHTFNVYSKVIKPVDNAQKVSVVGKQFAWEVEYPNTDLQFSNRLVLPSNTPITLNLSSTDVLHSFYVPEFRQKQDVVPGQETTMHIEKIRETGKYSIKCAELCGVGHYRMIADLYVITPEQFDKFISFETRDKSIEYLKKVTPSE